MATVQGGVIDQAGVSLTDSHALDLFLTSLGLPESNFSQIVATGGGAVFVDTSSITATTTLVVPTNNPIQIDLGATTGNVSKGSGPGTLAFQGSNVLGSANDATTLIADITNTRGANTLVGNEVKNAINDAVISFLGKTTGDTAVTVVDTNGSDGNSTFNLTNTSSDDTVLVVNGGKSSSIVNLADYGKVVLTGSSNVQISGSGSEVLIVNPGANSTVIGGSGSDTVMASLGNATISGGDGTDYFGLSVHIDTSKLALLENGLTGSIDALSSGRILKAHVTIGDFTVGEDQFKFNIDGVTNFAEFKDWLATAKQIGNDIVATSHDGDTITITGVQMSALNADMFHFS